MNGESDQKSARNKSDVKFNFLSGVCSQILCIFNHYRFISIPKKSTKNSKKLKISKTVNFTKKVHRTKKMQNLISHQTCSIKFPVSSIIFLILQQIRFLGGHLGLGHTATRGQVHLCEASFGKPHTNTYHHANCQKLFMLCRIVMSFLVFAPSYGGMGAWHCASPTYYGIDIDTGFFFVEHV